MKKGRIFVVSAPSGSGKTTICNKVLDEIKSLVPSVSFTTRKPRAGEKEKEDYFYISRERFQKEIDSGNLLEWEENFGYLYGTPKDLVVKALKEGRDLLISIDVKGALAVKKQFPKSVLVFIKPPSMEELSRRLRSRNTDGEEEIETRLKIAEKEMEYIPQYDHVVVNEKLDDAVNEVIDIIKKEKK